MHLQSCFIQRVQRSKAELKEMPWLLMLCFADRKGIRLVLGVFAMTVQIFWLTV